jgi:hypothetical protein
MEIYKLKYSDKKTALKDLIKKGVYIETKNFNDEVVLSYGKGIQAVVEIGLIVLENGVYDEDFKEVKPPVYADGYHFDIMSENKIDFGLNEITVNNPKHYFAGYEPKVETDLNTLVNENIS